MLDHKITREVMSNTDKQAQKDGIIVHSDDVSRTMQMLSTFLDDVITHIYGVNCQECVWGTSEEARPVFQFTFHRNNENNLRFNKFINDFLNLPTSLEKRVNTEDHIIGFDSVENIVLFLEHFSTYRDWGLNVPLENYVSDITSRTEKELDDHFSHITAVPDDSVMYLRKDAYTSFSECLPELRAAFTAANNRLPAAKFTYTLDEIRRSLNAFEVKQCGATNYNPQDVLWFH